MFVLDWDCPEESIFVADDRNIATSARDCSDWALGYLEWYALDECDPVQPVATVERPSRDRIAARSSVSLERAERLKPVPVGISGTLLCSCCTAGSA